MKTVQRQAAQGDVLVRRVDAIPRDAKPVAPTQGRHVIAHSETGHDHWMAADSVTLFADPQNPLVCYLRIAGDGAPGGGIVADIIHARPFDTHETLRLSPGVWEVRRQREMTPDGWRWVED